MKEKLADVFRRLFDAAELRPDLSPQNLPAWNSFAHLELVLELEKVFGLSIPAAEAAGLDSAGRILAYLESRGAGGQ